MADENLDPVATCGPADTDHDWDAWYNDARAHFGHSYERLVKHLREFSDELGECSWCGKQVYVEDGKVIVLS